MGMAYSNGDPKEPLSVSKPTKVLAMPLRPTKDVYITCIVCNQDCVEFEFASRTPGTRQIQGLHQRCAETIGALSDVT